MDIEEAAAQASLSAEQLVRLHQAGDALRVYMVGFAPGNPYIGLLPEQFGIPRRPTPRTSVPAGSVGVANRQTVIYPVEAPGGWNIIGCTPLKLFDPGRESPCLLKPGDRVRFKAITQDQFLEMRGGA